MDLSGPVAHSEFTKTKFSQDGSQARGTLNNCGNGYTPWGTYLTCEENWPGYFVNKGETTSAQERIGIATDKTRYGWDTLSGNKQERLDEFARFDVTPNRVSQQWTITVTKHTVTATLLKSTHTQQTLALKNVLHWVVSVTKAVRLVSDRRRANRILLGSRFSL